MSSAGVGDFDFFHGSWQVASERLKSRLTSSSEWETFGARAECWPILGGAGNVDTFRPEWPGHEGYEGASLRLFNPETGKWSIYWADTSGELFPPVTGGFAGGAGEFFGDDSEDGTPVRARFRWSEIRSGSPRWEQAFSVDQGRSWETNWVMSFIRIR